MTQNIMLRNAIEVFIIARRAESYSEETLTQYAWALSRFVKLTDKDIADVSTADIRTFLAYMQTDYRPVRRNGDDKPLGAASIFAAWKAIRAFYKWASPEFGVPNPAIKIPAPRHVPPMIVPFTQEEMKLILRACEKNVTAATEERKSYAIKRKTGVRDKAMIVTMLDTGLRVSELCRLQLSDYHVREGELVVSPFGASIKSRPRVVPLGASSRKAMALYMIQRGNERGPLFLTDEGTNMHRMNVLQILTRLGKKAGVEGVHPHRFRHTFAIEFLRNGGDVFSLQKMLGHTTLDMVKHYLDLAQSDVEAAHRKASPGDKWRL